MLLYVLVKFKSFENLLLPFVNNFRVFSTNKWFEYVSMLLMLHVKVTLHTRGVSNTTYLYFSNGPLWLIVLAYSIPAGVLGVWVSVLDVNLKPLGISQVGRTILTIYFM